jgi:renalase
LLLDDQTNELGRFDRVLIAAPAPQAAELLAAARRWPLRPPSVRYAPCWTLMIGFDAPRASLGRSVRQPGSAWLGRQRRRQARPSGEVWVLHANADWSRGIWTLDPEEVAVVAALLEAFAAIVGGRYPRSSGPARHRWLYSLADNPLDTDCLWDARPRHRRLRRLVCGARIEGAWLSGEALAGADECRRTQVAAGTMIKARTTNTTTTTNEFGLEIFAVTH